MGTLIEPVIVDDTVYYVEYTYTPETPAVFYLKNGDPGYPGEPAEVELISVTLKKDNANILEKLSPEEVDEILDYLIDYHENIQGQDPGVDDWMDDDFEDWED